MRKFQFRLDAVLRMREAQLELEKARLNQLRAEEQQLSTAVERITAERLEAKTFLRDLAAFRIDELRGVSSFLLGMEARAGDLRQRLEAAALSKNMQHRRVIEADRAVRLMAKLRDKRLAEWRRGASREIETLAQESWLASRHFGKQTRPPSDSAVTGDQASAQNVTEIS